MERLTATETIESLLEEGISQLKTSAAQFETLLHSKNYHLEEIALADEKARLAADTAISLQKLLAVTEVNRPEADRRLKGRIIILLREEGPLISSQIKDALSQEGFSSRKMGQAMAELRVNSEFVKTGYCLGHKLPDGSTAQANILYRLYYQDPPPGIVYFDGMDKEQVDSHLWPRLTTIIETDFYPVSREQIYKKTWQEIGQTNPDFISRILERFSETAYLTRTQEGVLRIRRTTNTIGDSTTIFVAGIPTSLLVDNERNSGVLKLYGTKLQFKNLGFRILEDGS